MSRKNWPYGDCELVYSTNSRTFASRWYGLRHSHPAWAVTPVSKSESPRLSGVADPPAIQATQPRMGSRFDSQLRAHFDSGALGFANDGTIAVRDASKIPLPQRVAVNQAVAEQGRDAKAVYREIAVANDHPEWEQQIRAVVARQWIDSARPGWWVQDAGGGWRQK